LQKQIREQLTTAIPHKYLNSIKERIHAFSNRTPLTIIEHMITEYGTLDYDDLQANLENLNRQWSPSQPLVDLWTQIQECQDIASGHIEITDMQAMLAAVANLQKSGVFTDALRDWRKRTIATQTLANLKLDFNHANKERRRELSSKEAGYAGAGIEEKPKNPPTIQGFYYCWTHGLGRFPNHTSKTCGTKAAGHQDTATLTNMMGGNNRIQRPKGQKQVWVPPPRRNTPPLADATNTTPN
jgi:hypothetical protein